MKKDSHDHLGRKILDLIKENEIDINDNEEILEIPLHKIKPHPNQPRKLFRERPLKELSESIKIHGVIQPIILKPDNGNFLIVTGERRVRASKIAGRETVPAVIRHYNSLHLEELSILENLQREELSIIEEALAYSHIIKRFNISHAVLAEKLGKSRSYVTNSIGLLKLPDYVVENIHNGKISMGHARILSKIKDEKQVKRLLDNIIKKNLTVRELEKSVKILRTNNEDNEKEINFSHKSLKTIFGNNAEIRVNGNKININFSTKKDLIETMKRLKSQIEE